MLREAPYLALLAAGAGIVTSATWAVLEGVDAGDPLPLSRESDVARAFRLRK